eukprot:209640_1
MGQQLQHVSACCGADTNYDVILNTQSTRNNDAPELQDNPMDSIQTPKLSDAQYEALVKERDKFQLQFAQVQQQLMQKDEALNKYRAQEKEKEEHNEYKTQAIQLMDAKSQLEQEIARLTQIVADESNKNHSRSDSSEIRQLKANIKALQQEKESLQQNENDDDIETHNRQLQHLTQLLASQQTENETLRSQLQQQNMDQKMVMHQHIQITNLPHSASAFHAVDTADKIQGDAETRVLSALEKVSSPQELGGMILKKYETVSFQDEHCDTSEEQFEVQDEFEQEDSLSHSSVDSAEAREIRHRKEAHAMKQELMELQKQNPIKKKVKFAIQTKDLDDPSLMISTAADSMIIPSSAPPQRPQLQSTGSRLYRASSHWAPHDVVKEKAEMQAQLAALMQTHIGSNTQILDTYDTV